MHNYLLRKASALFALKWILLLGRNAEGRILVAKSLVRFGVVLYSHSGESRGDGS